LIASKIAVAELFQLVDIIMLEVEAMMGMVLSEEVVISFG